MVVDIIFFVLIGLSLYLAFKTFMLLSGTKKIIAVEIRPENDSFSDAIETVTSIDLAEINDKLVEMYKKGYYLDSMHVDNVNNKLPECKNCIFVFRKINPNIFNAVESEEQSQTKEVA